MEVNINMNGMVSRAYQPLFESKERYIAIKGSRGSGKSEAVARKVILDIMTLPYVNWLVLRRYANTNRQSTYTLLRKVAGQMKVSNLFKFNDSMPEITYKPTGQKILFRGADKPLSITSVSVDTGNLARLWVEESYQIEREEAFEVVDESMRGVIDYPGGFYQTVLTFNPWNERHWLKRKFFDETAEPHTLAYTTTYKDNPFLDADYIERLETMATRNPRRAKVAVYGEWGVAEGLVFENTVVEDFDAAAVTKQAGIVVQGMDFGFSHDPTTFVEAVVNLKTKDIYITKELYSVGMKTDEARRWLVENGYQNDDIPADYAAGGDRMIAELRGKGIRGIRKARKYDVMFGISWMQDFTIHILPSLENTIAEFTSYAFDKDKEGNWINKPIDKDNHIIDALRYALERFMIPKKQLKDRMQQFKELGLGR